MQHNISTSIERNSSFLEIKSRSPITDASVQLPASLFLILMKCGKGTYGEIAYKLHMFDVARTLSVACNGSRAHRCGHASTASTQRPSTLALAGAGSCRRVERYIHLHRGQAAAVTAPSDSGRPVADPPPAQAPCGTEKAFKDLPALRRPSSMRTRAMPYSVYVVLALHAVPEVSGLTDSSCNLSSAPTMPTCARSLVWAEGLTAPSIRQQMCAAAAISQLMHILNAV
eukprot:352035-Chlamydomonas_euryale.AAC.2